VTNLDAGSIVDVVRSVVQSKGLTALRSLVDDMSADECERIAYQWRGLWARPCSENDDGTYSGQLPPDVPWDVWLICAGRGFGKTRTGAEWVREEVKKQPLRFAFVGQDPTDARAVMINGDSGIMAVTPENERPTYNPSTKLINWRNGSQAEVHSAHNFEALRGPQFHRAWIDEMAAFRYQQQTWDNLTFGMRLVATDGSQPKTCITTTPRPGRLLKEIIDDPGTVVTSGSTYENISNLSAAFIRRVIRRYEGTALGAQELYARLLDEVEGALWSREILEQHRVQDQPDLKRIVVAVDPMVRATENARRRVAPPETGVIVAGLGYDGHGYVLGDLSVTNAKPDVWARRVIAGYHDHRADRVVGEVNNGGDMVEDVIHTRDHRVPFKMVHASRGKRVRAEPISSLYQQGKVHHVGVFADLETQLCAWTGADGEPSPDRLDALVWAMTELMLGTPEAEDINYDATIGRGTNEWGKA